MTPRPTISVTTLLGNSQLLDGGSMFGNAPRPVWEKWLKPDEIGRIPLACRAMLIEIDQLKILCETGIGAYMSPKEKQRYGVQEEEHVLLASLSKLGIHPDEIDYVILSHLHFDHAGGLLSAYQEGQQASLLFAKAKYVVGEEAWQRAVQPHPRDRASFIPGLTDWLLASGRLLRIQGKSIPGIPAEQLSFIFSQGHTPGQMHTLVRGGVKSLFFAGDLVPGKAWVHLPITMGYDRFAELVIDEKARVYEQALAEDWYLFFTHDPAISAARLARDEKGRMTTIDEIQQWQRTLIS